MLTIAAALVMIVLSSGLAFAQARPTTPGAPAAPSAPGALDGPELKLDESTALRAAAVEARLQAAQAQMQAAQAQMMLLQRQLQDLNQEGGKILDERKHLLEDAGRRARVDVRDQTEWRFDTANQRYIKVKK